MRGGGGGETGTDETDGKLFSCLVIYLFVDLVGR